jgi:hypothetical protein
MTYSETRPHVDPDYRDPNRPLEPNVVRSAPAGSGMSGGTNFGMIAGSVAVIALIFGLAYYFNGDGDGGRNIATSKNPAPISAPATTGSGGASTTGSGTTGSGAAR